MNKSNLLSGTARIIREPSVQDLRTAMLHRLGAGHILNAEIQESVASQRKETPAKHAKPAAKSESDIMREREAGWIEDQLEKDLAALGCGAQVLEVRPDGWASWIVQMLQWNASGIGVKIDHVMHLERRNYRDPFEEGKLRRIATKRFAKTLKQQADLARDLGAPRIFSEDEIDLSRFSIDKPLAAVIEAFWPDGGKNIRRALATNNPHAFYLDAYNRDRPVISLSFGRHVVRGEFTIEVDGVTLKWSKGGLSVFGAQAPETLMLGCAGHPLKHVLQHEMFDGSMFITAVNPTRWNGMDGFALTLKDTTGPMPADW